MESQETIKKIRRVNEIQNLVTKFLDKHQIKYEYKSKTHLDVNISNRKYKEWICRWDLFYYGRITIGNDILSFYSKKLNIQTSSNKQILRLLNKLKMINNDYFNNKLENEDFTEEDIQDALTIRKLCQLKVLYDRHMISDKDIENATTGSLYKRPFMNVYSLEDLSKAKNLLDKDYIWICLCFSIGLDEMISNGFVPVTIDSALTEAWLQGQSMEELSYWHEDSWQYKNFLLLLEGTYDCNDEYFSYWIYPTQEYVQRKALKDANSLRLLMLFPNLVYKESKRPVNNMTMFKVADYIRLNEVPGDKITIDNVEYFYSPVTRYAQGMTRSLFFKNKNQNCKYCGTFYYIERESTTYLLYQNPLVGRTKSEVFIFLLERSAKRKDYEEHLHSTIIKELYYDKIFKNGLVMTARKAESLLEDDSDWKWDLNKNYTKYWGEEFGYAQEDELDQPICKMAKEQGYDVVIFENVVGSHQIVSELLDVRDRGDSFRHLAYLEL